jgi:UDP-N-acetyl-D-galactosamine dehydrogenase
VADAKDAERLYGVKFVKTNKFKDLDAVIIAVAHNEFKTLDVKTLGAMYGKRGHKVLVDVKGILDKNAFQKAGYLYWRL